MGKDLIFGDAGDNIDPGKTTSTRSTIPAAKRFSINGFANENGKINLSAFFESVGQIKKSAQLVQIEESSQRELTTSIATASRQS
jgi:hypothetical protein